MGSCQDVGIFTDGVCVFRSLAAIGSGTLENQAIAGRHFFCKNTSGSTPASLRIARSVHSGITLARLGEKSPAGMREIRNETRL